MISNQIKTSEYNPYYKVYIDNATDIDIIKGLKQSLVSTIAFYTNLPFEKHDFAYADGKWTIKEILLHIIDTERIFAYRALRIARKDKTALVGFEQDDYVVNAKCDSRSLNSLIEEYRSVRHATLTLFKSFDADSLLQIGKASGSDISVRALGYIITGHENHHNQVIKERYL